MVPARGRRRARALRERRRAAVARARARARPSALGSRARAAHARLLAPLGNVEGYGSARLSSVQRRSARARGAEPDPALLRSLALAALTRGDFEEAARAGERLLERADRDGDRVMTVEGHYVLGIAAFWQSDLTGARHHFEAAVGAYRPEHRATHVVGYGLDPQVVCLSRLANALGFLGDADGGADACEPRSRWPTRSPTSPRADGARVRRPAGPRPGRRGGLRRHTAALRRQPEVKAATVTTDRLRGLPRRARRPGPGGLNAIRRVLDDVSEPGWHAPGNRASLVHVLVEASAVAEDHRGGLAATEIFAGIRLRAPCR